MGQTAVKTNKVIDSALDGVLFIDEAYSLVSGDNTDYGKEAIATLLKRMEDNRNQLVVILAGYDDEMKQFIDSSVSDEMIEAARIDGAGELRIYWQVVMPLVKPAWLTLLVTTFQSVWNTGASSYVWSEQLKTFNSAIATIQTVSAGASSAGTFVMMSVPIIFFIINQAKIVETMGSSGMKD